MKRAIVSIVVLALAITASADRNPQYEEYIQRWYRVALEHQVSYGIPASITMAQGILESQAGRSELATKANNHFGIKCTSDWMGASYSHDDDRKGECFRLYRDAEQSYIDHAKFLQRDRYRSCFDIPVTDYAHWARQLKACGYATDPAYPQKLIRIIEEYGLADGSRDVTSRPAPAIVSAAPVIGNQNVGSEETDMVDNTETPLTAAQEKKNFLSRHPKQKVNGCTYVVAQKGDTYANVAFRLNVKERDLRVWNDALGRQMQAGDYIFLSRKAAKVKDKRKELMWVTPGETLWFVSQREGIQMEKIRRYNGWDKKVNTFTTRQKILLAPERK